MIKTGIIVLIDKEKKDYKTGIISMIDQLAKAIETSIILSIYHVAAVHFVRLCLFL